MRASARSHRGFSTSLHYPWHVIFCDISHKIAKKTLNSGLPEVYSTGHVNLRLRFTTFCLFFIFISPASIGSRHVEDVHCWGSEVHYIASTPRSSFPNPFSAATTTTTTILFRLLAPSRFEIRTRIHPYFLRLPRRRPSPAFLVMRSPELLLS